MENILSAAEEILGTAVRVEDHRNWAIFWCPFHNDASREGEGGQPNFGVNLVSGYWKCLRCGASGGSLKSLQTKLGQASHGDGKWKPTVSATTPTRPKRPPTHPTVMNVRYIPENQIPKGTRTFMPLKNHKTWGNRVQPLGSWRITPATRTLVVLEGLFDMLITAQKLHQLGREADTVAVYTNGASPSAKLHRWFSEHPQFEYVLLRDPDKAGAEWVQSVSASIRHGGAKVRALRPPDSLDPDEAILSGWWPSAI